MTTKIKDMFNKNPDKNIPLLGVTSFLLVLVFPLILGAAEPSKAPSPAKTAPTAVSPAQSAASPSSKPSLPQPPSSAGNIAQQSKEALKEIEKAKTAYFYDPRGKRDPFRSPYMEEKTTTTQVLSEEEKITLEGLQQFKANALQLTGIIIKGKEHVAMVKAPDGRIYILREKSKVGPAGIVKKILKSKVIIEEEYTLKVSDDFGNVTTRKEKKEVVMSLHNT